MEYDIWLSGFLRANHLEMDTQQMGVEINFEIGIRYIYSDLCFLFRQYKYMYYAKSQSVPELTLLSHYLTSVTKICFKPFIQSCTCTFCVFVMLSKNKKFWSFKNVHC